MLLQQILLPLKKIREKHLPLVLRGWLPKQDLCQAMESEQWNHPVLEGNAIGQPVATQGRKSKDEEVHKPSLKCSSFPSLFP